MKRITHFLLIIAALLLHSACRQNLLDVNPVTMLTKEQIYASPEGVTAYFASLYRDMPIEDYTFCNGRFGEFPGNGDSYTANWTEEAFAYGTRNSQMNAENWGKLYNAIRNVNTFLEEIAGVTNVDEPTKARYTAEARFVRAYYYFALVKYWGGVPILTGPALDPEPLRSQPRNKETEVWDLIKEDLEFAAANLPEESPYGRANKYVALGLTSRAMLHAGSIGKFGTVQLNGVVGVDAAKANEYLQASYAASKTIIEDGRYSLFKTYAATDLVRNFQYLFYECKPGDQNPEAIFCKGFDFNTTQSTHSQDLMVLPDYIRSPDGYANRLQPTLDFVEKFEYRDGSAGTLNIGTPGNYVHYGSLSGPFENKDPRLAATVVIPGTEFRGEVITAQRGVVYNNQEYNGNTVLQYFNTGNQSFQGGVTPVVGTGNSATGPQTFWLKKWTDPEIERNLVRAWTSRTSWIDIRYGEILLNYAEASFELGNNPSEALGAINQIRERAGMPLHDAIDRTKIRHERAVELAFENKTYWDYVRWRTLTTEFNVRQLYGLDIYYDVDAGDYVFKKVPHYGGKTYQQRDYYFQIPGGERALNTALIDNPHY